MLSSSSSGNVSSSANSRVADNSKKTFSKPREEIINKRLATEIHPTIQAVINGMFRFEKKEQAFERVEAIKNYFIVSNKLPKDDKDNVLKLWIRGFKIDEDEEKNGFLGNYAAIKVKEVDGKFTLVAEKQRIALKYHPQRKRPKQKHPDWGHPALRIVKKGVIFETLDEAQKILNQLHEEYPQVTIPNPGKLYIIIYGKSENSNRPIHKYILEIKASREGGYFIEYKQNKFQRDGLPNVAKDKANTVKNLEEDRKPKGYFTSMVELKQKKKSTKAKPKAEKKETSE